MLPKGDLHIVYVVAKERIEVRYSHIFHAYFTDWKVALNVIQFDLGPFRQFDYDRIFIHVE